MKAIILFPTVNIRNLNTYHHLISCHMLHKPSFLVQLEVLPYSGITYPLNVNVT